MLKTTNGGNSWDISYYTSNDLKSVYIADAYHVYAVGSNGTFIRILYGSASWDYGDGSPLTSVYFTNANIGFVVGGNGTIRKTTNSGNDWITQSSGTSYGLSSVYFTDENTGYAVGESGTMLKTTNAGNNWTALSTVTSNWLYSVYFSDAILGYAVGDYGTIVKAICTGTPSVPEGETSCCQGAGPYQYTTAGASYATSYKWSLIPSEAGDISGTGTTSTVTCHDSFSGNATVVVYGLKEGCIGDSSYLEVTVTPLPADAGSITGETSVCQGQNSVTYTVPEIENATSYVWALPSGVNGTSSTNSITVDYGLTAITGSISVKGTNACGDGEFSELEITVNEKPPTPTVTLNQNILSSDTPDGNQWYNQNGIIDGATDQTYTATESGDYYVIVTLLGCSSEPSNTMNVVLSGVGQAEGNSRIRVYPNPVSNNLIIEIEGNGPRTGFQILNSAGQVVCIGDLVEKTTISTINYGPGIYIIRFENGKTFEFKKIVKN